MITPTNGAAHVPQSPRRRFLRESHRRRPIASSAETPCSGDSYGGRDVRAAAARPVRRCQVGHPSRVMRLLLSSASISGRLTPSSLGRPRARGSGPNGRVRCFCLRLPETARRRPHALPSRALRGAGPAASPAFSRRRLRRALGASRSTRRPPLPSPEPQDHAQRQKARIWQPQRSARCLF